MKLKQISNIENKSNKIQDNFNHVLTSFDLFSFRSSSCNVAMVDNTGTCKLFDIHATTITLMPSPNVETYVKKGTLVYLMKSMHACYFVIIL